MALRLHGWNRRLLGLGVGMLFCGSVGCTTTNDDNKPLTNKVSKTTMGPGNSAMSSPEPLVPANPADGSNVVRNPAAMSPAYNNIQPAAPVTPNANPQYVSQLSTQLSTSMNPASFSQPPVQPLPANNFGSPSNNITQTVPSAPPNNYNVTPTYPMQQPTGGQQMTVPTLATQPPVSAPPQQYAQAPLQGSPSAPNQMQNVQMPPQYSGQSAPATVPPYVPVPVGPAPTSQNIPSPPVQSPLQAPQQHPFNQSQLAPSSQNQAPYVPQPPIQPAVQTQLQQAPIYGSQNGPGRQSMNQPSQTPNPSGNVTPASIAASRAALESDSMAISAKAVASGQMRSISDPTMNIQEPVVIAPVTIPAVSK